MSIPVIQRKRIQTKRLELKSCRDSDAEQLRNGGRRDRDRLRHRPRLQGTGLCNGGRIAVIDDLFRRGFHRIKAGYFGETLKAAESWRIAVARALYKDAPFIILDGPTAALDPVAEAEVYSKFDEIAGDKTAIYISHRLSSCKFCDEIAVFHEGAVVQQGAHAERVVDERGKYYELWHAQAQYYAE